MALYPGAVYKPTPWGGRTPRNHQGRGILHVAVSGARSLPPWNGNTWHMYVAFDGYCEQYVDSDFPAYASGDANDDAFSIETAGGLGPSSVLNAERWTDAQAERLADIMRWLQTVDGTPLDLMPDSKPGRRGWGPHRLGIEHSRGIGAVPGWLLPGGERWSSHIGKECPGDAKVAQVAELLELARNGGDDMPSKEEFIDWVRQGVISASVPKSPGGVGPADLDRFVMRIADDANGANQKGSLILAALKQLDVTLSDADVEEIVVGLAGHLPDLVSRLSDEDIERIKQATADEIARRAQD